MKTEWKFLALMINLYNTIHMKTLYPILLISAFIVVLASCTKGPGAGGRASIQGKIFARNYSNSYLLTDSGYIGGQKIYIKYGDEPGVSDDVDTDQNGEFIFEYLREGNYTLIVYSKQLVNNTLDSAVVRTVTISSRKQSLDIGRIDIITLKN